MTSRLSRPRCAIVNCRCSTCCMAEPALPQAFSLCAYYIPACCHRPVRQPHYLTAFALLPHTRVVKSTARCPGSHHEPSRGSATRSLYAPLRRHLPTSTTTQVHAGTVVYRAAAQQTPAVRASPYCSPPPCRAPVARCIQSGQAAAGLLHTAHAVQPWATPTRSY